MNTWDTHDASVARAVCNRSSGSFWTLPLRSAMATTRHCAELLSVPSSQLHGSLCMCMAAGKPRTPGGLAIAGPAAISQSPLSHGWLHWAAVSVDNPSSTALSPVLLPWKWSEDPAVCRTGVSVETPGRHSPLLHTGTRILSSPALLCLSLSSLTKHPCHGHILPCILLPPRVHATLPFCLES